MLKFKFVVASIIFSLLLPIKLYTYDFSYKLNNQEFFLDFNNGQIDKIKFSYFYNNQKNYGIIKYLENEIEITISTDEIEFSDFKKFFPKPQKNNNLKKKINFSWDIGELIISNDYSLKSNKLNFVYDDGFESMIFYDSNKEFEFSIIPQDGDKQMYMFAKNAGQFFYAQKISKDIVGGALIGKGSFRRFDDYDLTIKVKDFSISKDAKYYDLISTSRLLDVFSLLQNNQDEFNYLEVPITKRGKIFNFDHAIMLGGTVAFSFKGEAIPFNKTAIVNGTYGPLYLFEQNFKDVPFINELFGKNVEESLLAADFKVIKNGSETEFIFNPLSILTPGKTRNIFDIWE